MTSISPQSQIPSQASSNISATAPAPSYATATKKAVSSPLVATSSSTSSPAVAVGGAASGQQNVKNTSLSPANGRSTVTPAIPAMAYSSGTTNNATSDHSRKGSVSIPTNGGYMPNGGPVGGQKPSIQFGALQNSPATVHSTPQIAQPVATNPNAVSKDQGIPSPAHSPSPIPQPATTSGGRPPSGLQNHNLSFGGLGADVERHYRQPPPNQSPLVSNAQLPHVRRESSGEMGHQMSNSSGRGGYPAQGGRGRGGSYNNGNYSQHQMGYNPAAQQFRGQPGQGRGGMPPQFQGQSRPMQYPNSPHQAARSPALTNSIPGTPNMGQAMPMPPQPYGYPQHYMGGPQQVQTPSTFSPIYIRGNYRGKKTRKPSLPHTWKPKQSASEQRDVSREVPEHVVSSNTLDLSGQKVPGRPQWGSFLDPSPSFSSANPAGLSSLSFAGSPAFPDFRRPEVISKIDLSPESGNFDQFLTMRQNYGAYAYDRNTGMPIMQYQNMPYMQGMQGPPQSPQPGFQSPYMSSPYNGQLQPQPMSRTSSQLSERPNSSLGHSQPSATGGSTTQTPQSKPAKPAPVQSTPFQRARKSAAIVIKRPDGEVLDLPATKAPASPAPSTRSRTPPVASTPTPPPKIATPQHTKTESIATKTQEQIRNEFKEQMRKAAEGEAMAEAEAKAAEATKIAAETKAVEEARAKEINDAKIAEDAKRAEEARVAEETRLAEETKLAEEAKLAAEVKAAEDAKAKSQADAEAEAARKKQEEDDELERQIKEMEEADERREKEEAEREAKRKEAKAAAEKADSEKRLADASENDRKLQEQEREMERLEDERERKRQEAEAKPSTDDKAEAAADAKSDADALAAEVKADNEEIAAEAEEAEAEMEESATKPLTSKLSSLSIEGGAGTDESMGPPAKVQAGEKKGKPAALTLAPLDTKPTEAPQPSAALQSLKSARFLRVLDNSIYPANIQSPNPALNAAVASKGKSFKYDTTFLLQFQTVFTEKPSLEFESQIKSLIGDSEPGSARSASKNAAGMGPRGSNRHNASTPFSMGAIGAFAIGDKSTLPRGTTSEQRYAMSTGALPRPAANPMNSFTRPGGAFPMGNAIGQRAPSGSNNMSNSQRTPSNRARGGGGGGGSKRDFKDTKSEAQAAKTMPLTAGMDLKPIQVSATGWKPRSLAANATGAAGPTPGASGSHMDPDMVQRKVKAALNKMTPEKFDKIADQILTIAAQSKDEADGRTLRQVIALTFEKATDEAHWASMYAKFCKRMLETMSPDIRDESILDKNGNVVSGGNLFRKYLLNRCQEEFERGWKMDLPDKPEGEEGDEAKTAEAAMLSDEYYIAAAAKRRGLGLVQFIGELYKLGMLTERIMHECVKKLVDYTGVPDEAEVESLTKLLKTIGSNLDSTEKGKPMMDAYFSRIQAMMDTPELPSRLRFMLMDIVDLRKVHWHSKEDNKGPKTLEEVRAEAELAAAQKAAENARGSQRGGGGGGGGRMPAGRGDSRYPSGGYGNQPPTDYSRTTVATDDLRRLGNKAGSNRPSGPMAFGPTSMFSSRSNSGRKMGPGGSLSRTGEDSGLSSRTGTPPSQKDKETTTSVNAFSVLGEMDSGETENPASPPSVAASPALAKAAVASPSQESES